MTGVAKETALRALVEVGMVCADHQDHVFRNLSSQRLQLDEMWGWIYCKEKNRPKRLPRIILMLATFSSGLRWMPIQNWFPLGCSDNVTPEPQGHLLTTLLRAFATESRSQPMVTGHTWKRLKTPSVRM
jgi:hypothetical protein